MKIKNFLVIFFTLFIVLLLADGIQPLGNGTESSPYQITSLDNLLWVSTNNLSWDKHFVQTADIDASATQNWNEGAGFIPIGNNNTHFTGKYDGAFFQIQNLYINRPSFYIGFIGFSLNAEIKNLILTNANISGISYVGVVLAFSSYTEISNCSSSGNVHGNHINTGGLIGYSEYSTIDKCFSNADIDGDDRAGGVVGALYNSSLLDSYFQGEVSGTQSIGGMIGHTYFSTVERIYSTGLVTGDTNVGGLIGDDYNDDSSTVTNSFWNTENSNQAISAGGIGKTTSEMQDYQMYLVAGWDIIGETENGTDDIWGINYFQHNGYPFLSWEDYQHDGIEGSGTLEDPYIINSIFDLNWLSSNSTAWSSELYFSQIADIDASPSQNWNNGAGFIPIGEQENGFEGTYNGNGYSINNLFINRPEGNAVGLFGMIVNATLTNINIIGANITGYSFVSFLSGKSSDSTFSNCSTSGTVNALSNFVGGFSGIDSSSDITCCFNTGNIVGYGIGTGGILGTYLSSTVSNCYNMGQVQGYDGAGGLVGYAYYGSITTSYSTGVVTGSFDTGGLVGIVNINTQIENCLWDIEASNISISAGGIGKTSDEMRTYQTYIDEGWDFSQEEENGNSNYWRINSLENSGYPFLSWEGYSHMRIFGNGTAENPYQINTVNDLWWVSQIQSIWDKNFLQTSDIDFSELENWLTYENISFNPIGNYNHPFTGNFNGNFFTIDNFSIDSSEAYIGFFGATQNAVISNVTLINAEISGSSYVGILIGNSSSSQVDHCCTSGVSYGLTSVGGLIGHISNSDIEHCSTSGTVIGDYSMGNDQDRNNYQGFNIGGFAGYIINNSSLSYCYSSSSVSGGSMISGFAGKIIDSSINDCYSTGNVSGYTCLGGFVANSYNSSFANCYSTGEVHDNTQEGHYNDDNQRSGGFAAEIFSSTISKCYSIGLVNATIWAGGFIGKLNDSTVTSSFWDIDSSNQIISAGGVGKTSTEMKNYYTYYNAGWDFEDETINGSGDHWGINLTQNGGYPFLSFQNDYDNLIVTLSGNGTVSSPYVINTLEELGWLSATHTLWDANFIQLSNIDASDTQSWNNGLGFNPIGTSTINFTGSYNGLNHQIQNLHIDQSSAEEAAGLFRYIDTATCENIVLTDVNINGFSFVGSLAGHAENCLITNCSSSGTVSASTWAGHLIGTSIQNTISNCHSSGSVQGTSAIGGLIGQDSSSDISNCYSRANIEGEYVIGGLLGLSRHANITNCYSTGLILGSTVFGGFIGDVNNTTIISSFWDTETSNQSTSPGGVGKTTEEMQNYSTFYNAGWDFINETNNGINDLWGINPQENGGYPFLAWQGYQHISSVDSPTNVAISVTGNQLTITWDEVSGATAYKIFACETPNGEFIDISSDGDFGTARSFSQIKSKKENGLSRSKTRDFSRTSQSWTITITSEIKFFSVKAVQ